MAAGHPHAGPAVRALLIGEYIIGHVPYIDALGRAADARDDIDLDVVRLPFAVGPWASRVPAYGSVWSVRASVRALTRSVGRWRGTDVALVHTQTASLLLTRYMRRVPTFLSADATPMNLDEVAAAYGHDVRPAPVEAAKRALLRRPFQAAAGVVAWSSWVEESLVRDYGVRPERVHVVRPGALLPPRPVERSGDGPVRLLFVGGDFSRKGGPHLLEAFRGLTGEVELDLVTHADVPGEPGVRVHRGLKPDSAALLELYAQADIAVLPTLGDASPYAVVEAMAYGLPVVTTDVGAVAEAVLPERTGLLVPPGDESALRAALQRLVDGRELRRELGRRGRQRAEEVYDGRRNADRVLDLLRDRARGAEPRRPGPRDRGTTVTPAKWLPG